MTLDPTKPPRCLQVGDVPDHGYWPIIDMVHSSCAGWIAVTSASILTQRGRPSGLDVDCVRIPWPPAPEDGAA